MKNDKTDAFDNTQINNLEYNYNLIHIHYITYKDKNLSEEQFNEIKDDYLNDDNWKDEYLKLKSDEALKYFFTAFDELFELYLCGAVSKEQFRQQYKIIKRLR